MKSCLVLCSMASAAAFAAFALPVEWTFPRDRGCHEGMAFGNGRTGVLVWGGGDEIRLTVGRSDMWDHRGGYEWTPEQNYKNILAAVRADDRDRLRGLFRKVTPKGEPRNPYMLPLGRVVVKVPGRTMKRGALDPYTGLGEIEFEDGGKVGLAMSKKAGGAFAMSLPRGAECEVKTVPSTDFPVYEQKLAPIGFERASTFDNAVPGRGGMLWRLPADKPVWLSWAKKDGVVVVKTGRGPQAAWDSGSSFDEVAAASREHWTAFWAEGARVKVPDPALQRVFEYGMYKFGAMTDPDGIPAGLQGVWLEDDKLVPWNGDYHFNINVQECYSPAYRGGHFRNLLPLFRMVLSWRPKLRDNARKLVGIDDGYVLPHSVDDRGVCIGGFWTGTIDHGSTAWVAAMMMNYVRYSGDVAFLRENAYDFLKGVMNVYRAMIEDDGVTMSLPLGSSPEWGRDALVTQAGKNPAFQLAAVHRVARDLCDAAQMLGVAPDPMWADVDRRLPHFERAPMMPGGYYDDGILIFAGEPLSFSHRHHSHMAGFWPFDTIDLSDKETRFVADLTYWNWALKGMGLWAGWSMPWASILHTHIGNSDAAVDTLRLWDRYFCNDGHGSRHDTYRPGLFGIRRGTNRAAAGVIGDAPGEEIMQMDGQCCAVAAVMELLVHEVNGKVEFFRGCPDTWTDVSFENIALSDGRRISGRREGGRVSVR